MGKDAMYVVRLSNEVNCRLIDRLEVYCAPKHGRRLDIAES